MYDSSLLVGGSSATTNATVIGAGAGAGAGAGGC